MKTKAGSVIVALATIALIAIAANGLQPHPVAFKAITKQSFLGTLSWLFVVALFVERAVEVIVSVVRDGGAAPMEQDIKAAQEKVDEQARVTPGAVAYLGELHAAQKKLSDYRSDTKEFALCASFVLSVFVSLAGVRAFDAITDKAPDSNWLFITADVIITGAVLAGGTDAIHQMANVFTDFMNSASEKAKGT